MGAMDASVDSSAVKGDGADDPAPIALRAGRLHGEGGQCALERLESSGDRDFVSVPPALSHHRRGVMTIRGAGASCLREIASICHDGPASMQRIAVIRHEVILAEQDGRK